MSSSFRKFLSQIGELHLEVDKLSEHVKKGKRFNSAAACAPMGPAQDTVSLGMLQVEQEFREDAERIKKSVEELKREGSPDSSNKYVSAWKDQILGIEARIKKARDTFKEAQAEFCRIEKERNMSKALIARPNATREELARMDSAAIEAEFGNGPAMQVIMEAEERHVDMNHICKRIEDVRHITLDFLDTIESSGERIDRVSKQLQGAGQSTDDANRNIEQAKAYRKRMAKVKRFFAVVLVFLVGAAVLWAVLKITAAIAAIRK